MKQFCVNGHDTFVVGRYPYGGCVECVRIRVAARMQIAANKERTSELARVWDSQNPEKRRAYRRRYYANNKEEMRERNATEKARECRKKYSKAWHAGGRRARFLASLSDSEIKRRKEYARERSREYYLRNRESVLLRSKSRPKNPEVVRANAARRRARKRNVPVMDFTIEQWNVLVSLYEQRCAYCDRKTEKLQQDHVIPLSKGGAYTLSNIVPACISCNSSKKDKSVSEFLAFRRQVLEV